MTLAEMIHAAEDTNDPHDYIARIKSVVAGELERLDSTARLEDTLYFNHSAIPDFIVTWGGERARREIFLRHSYASVEAADDERFLADADAMVMSLRPGDQDLRNEHDPAAAPSSRLLVTDTEAVDVIGGAPSANVRPLTSLVRANFLRGAKGRVDTVRAEQLLQLDDPQTPASSDAAQELIATSFAEDAALRINRTVELISIALGGEEKPAPNASGRLSLAELRSLLPWLLRQDGARSNMGFWRYVGSLFTFEELEGIRHDLTGLDLSPLIAANGALWTARRAYVGLQPPGDDDTVGADNEARWSFENTALGINVAGRRLYLAHNGTMLKRRPGNRTPDWDAVRPTIDGRRIASIELRGIRRSVILHAEESPDIRADVEDVTRELDDAYYVDRLTLRVLAPGEAEGTRDVDVRFDEGLIVADSDVSLAELTRAALQVLEFADPVPADITDEVLGIARDVS